MLLPLSHFIQVSLKWHNVQERKEKLWNFWSNTSEKCLCDYKLFHQGWNEYFKVKLLVNIETCYSFLNRLKTKINYNWDEKSNNYKNMYHFYLNRLIKINWDIEFYYVYEL